MVSPLSIGAGTSWQDLTRAGNARWLRALAPHAPRIALYLAIVLLAYVLSRLFWTVLTPLPDPASLQAAPGAQVRAAPAPDLAAAIAARQLFGRPPRAAAAEAPETRLNLTLRGVFALEDGQGIAIVARGGSAEDLYPVGAQLPGGAVVREVHADRILLERAGALETLRLPEQTDSGLQIATAAPQAATGGRTAAIVAEPLDLDAPLGQVRDRLLREPARLAEIVSIEPQRGGDGGVTGYRLSPRGDGLAFDQFGLLPGDVVTEVNGIPASDGVRAMRELMRADSLALTIQRGGELITLEEDLGP
jgi:general secretion pathway protein C